MSPLFVVLFGFVAFPVVMLSIVITQLSWSMWIFDADLERPPLLLHALAGVGSLAVCVAVTTSECRPRASVKYHCAWSLCGGKLFQGQLRLGMRWWKQLLLGCSLGVLASLIDESEVFAALTMSPATLDKLRAEFGPRAGAAHVAHAHDALLLAFVLHGWFWTLCTAAVLGSWSNAAKLHTAEVTIEVD